MARVFEYVGGMGMGLVKPKSPIAETFYKQPWESYLMGVDFSWAMTEGEILVVGTSTIIAVDKDGLDSSAIVLDNDDKVVTTADSDDITATPVTNAMLVTRIQAGTVALSKYLITYRGITSYGNQYELDLKMSVKEPSV